MYSFPVCVSAISVAYMPRKTSTMAVRGEWELADVLADIAAGSAYYKKSRRGLMAIAMKHAQANWQFAPATPGQKVEQVGNPFRAELLKIYRSLKEIEMGTTHVAPYYPPALDEVRNFSFAQLALSFSALYPYMSKMRNPYLSARPELPQSGRFRRVTLDPQQMLSCVCKLNLIGAARVGEGISSPFCLIAMFAEKCGARLLPNQNNPLGEKNDFSADDPDTRTFDFSGWGHLAKMNIWGSILAADSPAASFSFAVLGLNISWEVGATIIRGTIKEL